MKDKYEIDEKIILHENGKVFEYDGKKYVCKKGTDCECCVFKNSEVCDDVVTYCKGFIAVPYEEETKED